MARVAKKGFVKAGAGENAAWAKVDVGALWCGQLMGRFEFSKRDAKTGKIRYFYQLKLTQVPFIDDDGKEHVPFGLVRDPETEEFGEDPVILEEGALVNIDARFKLDQALLALTKETTPYEVVIQALSKKNLDGGHTMWDFEVLKAPLDGEPDSPIT